jgi:hypothetical protein
MSAVEKPSRWEIIAMSEPANPEPTTAIWKDRLLMLRRKSGTQFSPVVVGSD